MRVLGTTALVAWIGSVAPAAAGDEPALEYVVVTGTRIEQPDVVSPSPIVTVPGDVLRQSATFSIEKALSDFPQFTPTATGTSNDPSNDGQANLALRGLGPSRTLILLDGRRLMPADGRGSVDLNVLPSVLVESVDIVTGGASAVYGSDAIAGIVNISLKDRYSGVSLDGGASVTDRGDGEEYSASVTAGTDFAAGRGSVYGSIGYWQREQINQDARDFSRYPLEYVAPEPGQPPYTSGRGPGGAFIASGSGITDEGINIVFARQPAFDALFASYGYPVGTVALQQGFGVNGDGTVYTTGNGTSGSVVNFRGVRDPVMFNDRIFSVYNFAPDTALQMPLERTSIFLRGQFDHTEHLQSYLQLLYANYTATRQLAPAEAGIALIPATNPYISPDLKQLLDARPNPEAPYRYFRRASEVGPRTAENDRELTQLTLGVRGELAADWRFDAYAQWGQNDRTERQTNNVLLSQLEQLTFAPDAGASLCSGGFNPFLAGSLSAECADFISADAANEVTVRQTLAEAVFDGPVWSLPAGPVRAAVGVFYKRDEFRYDADATLSAQLPGVPGVIGPRPDVAGFSAAPDRAGEQNNVDAYVELRAPLLRDQPAARALDLGLGYRYSDYSRFGGVDTYKVDLLYQPVVPVHLRGSYQHAVRAPSIEELFYPLVSSQFEVPRPDPCDRDSAARTGPNKAQVEALCLAQGIPAEVLPGYSFDLRRADGQSGGNPALQPEEADTVTAGVVYDMAGADDAGRQTRVSVDWYRIRIDDGIGRWDSKSAVERCFDPAFNPRFDPGNIYCSFIARDPTNGNLGLLIQDRNLGGFDTSGVDLQFDWSQDAGRGRVGATAYLTYVDQWQYEDPGGKSIQYAGTVGGAGATIDGGGLGRSIPRWKSLLNLNYTLGGARLLARWRHIDTQRDVVYREFEVPAVDYFDLGVQARVDTGPLAGLMLRAGVDNLLDEDPPIYPTWQQANTDPATYDVLGRRYYLNLQYGF
jgi:outer membrane receptor protein involved in Fe transport